MRVVHLLRKCNSAEWGGTESAIQRLIEGLSRHEVTSLVYCPHLDHRTADDSPARLNCRVNRFHACLPVWGVSRQRKAQLVAVGGNLMSFDLPGALWREPDVSVIHTHALGRLGGIALAVARCRRIPLVVTIHGGFLDLPDALRAHFRESLDHGWEWGKICGLFLRSRQLVPQADAVLTCNPREAALLRERYPRKRILVQPHGVPVGIYRNDHRMAANEAFPEIRDKRVLLSVGRIDPIKNQGWLIEQAPAILGRHPDVILVLAGACTDEEYGRSLDRRIRELGLGDRILVTGGFAPADPRLIGLFQLAGAVALPSLSETFGLVILEAWAAGAPVIASRTSGASALVKSGCNGWLFGLDNPGAFHDALDHTLNKPALAKQQAAEGGRLASAEFDTATLAGRVRNLYRQLIEEKHALRNSAG